MHNTSKKLKIVIMAGGTGGHVFPGIAIAHELQKANVEIHWLGTQGGLEKNWVEKAGLDISEISIRGLRGNGALGWLKAPFNITRAWWQARKILKQQQADLVLGMGGFVCGPGGLAAKSLGIPLMIHEQNAIPGLTNKLLAPFCESIITAFEQEKLTGDKVHLMGNPVRQGLESIPVVEWNSDRPVNLLVLGGSRGALALNQNLPKALALLPASLRPVVQHQTGTKTLEQTLGFYQQAGIDANITAFIEDMQSAYEKADLVLCRSGALTVSELMAVARPAIMVPYPYAVDDHQTQNAQALVDLQGGEILQERDMNEKVLAEHLNAWLAHPERLMQASKMIRQNAPQQALENICQHLLDFCQSRQSSLSHSQKNSEEK